MPRVSHNPPAWVAEYVGRPYEEHGCYRLVRAVYAERFGVALPAYSGRPDEALAEQLGEGGEGEEGGRAVWRPVAPPDLEVGDVALFRVMRDRLHVGVVVSQTHMLHALKSADACLERFLTPMWAGRLRAIYRYCGGVHVVARSNPFAHHRVDVVLPAGGSVAELLAAAHVAAVPGLRAFVSGSEVPRELWGSVRPKPGRLLTVACIPDGGGNGKDALRIVLSIAVIAASVAIPGSAVFAGTIFAAGGFAGAALSAGIAIAGTLAINALVPPPRPRLSAGGADTTASPTIQGARNESRPYAPIPVVLGRHRVAPPYAAVPYTEVVGDEQYLRCLFAIGYGPLAISDLKIGDTPIEQFEGVQVQVHRGYINNRTLSIYPNTVTELPLSVLLSAAAGWQTRTSALAAEELAVDVTFPTGLVQLDRAGEASNRQVDVEVEYRAVGSGTWLKVNGDAGASGGSPTTELGLDFLFRTPDASFGGVEDHAARVAWSGTGGLFPDAKPAYLPAAGFAWRAEGYVYAPQDGTYEFGVDGSDACDLEVDSQSVASFYGQHAPQGSGGVPDFTGHTGSIDLEEGWHQIAVRVECRSAGGGALALGWKKPGDPSFSIIPAASLATGALGDAPSVGRLRVYWYTFAAYISSLTTIAAKTDQIRRSLSWAVPSGQYDVRLRRTTADSTDPRTVDQVYWTALRSIDHTDPVRVQGIARVALRIKATDQLNGVVDQFNCVAHSLLREYNQAEGRWVRKATSNPAALYRAVLQGRANDSPIPDARIDLAELAAWSEDCRTKGWEFNGVIDFAGTVYERLTDVAAAGRATFGMRDGKYSVVRDRVLTTPVQHFTPRNSFGFQGRKVFHTLPHALRVRFISADAGYQEDERVVLNDGYQIDGLDAFGNPAPALPAAEVFEEIQFFGCTSPDLAFRHGRYYLAVAKLRPEVFEVSTDFEHLVCSRGDLVLLTHDVPLVGLSAGRVLRLNTDNDGTLTSLDLDEECPMEAGGTYRLRVRLADSTTWTRDLVTVEGANRKVFFVTPVPPASVRPEVGDLFMFGPTGQETRELIVKSIEIDKDLAGRLTLVDHATAVHNSDTETIPDFDSGITRDPVFTEGPEPPVVESIRSDDFVMFRDAGGTLRPRIVLTLKRQSGTRPLAQYCQVRVRLKDLAPATTVGPWTQARTVPIDNNQIAIDDVIVGRTYQVSLRNLTAAGRASEWVYTWVATLGGPVVLIEHTVVGQTLPPPDPVSFDVARLSDGTREYTWDLGLVPPDIAGVHIRYGAVGGAWGDLAPLHDDVLQSSPSELNVPPAGTWRFGLKAMDAAGNESVNAILIDRTLGQPRLEGVAFSDDARLAGWPGTKTDCFVSGPQRFLEAVDDATWSNLSGTYGIADWASFTRWNVDPRSPIVYEHPPLDAGIAFDFSPDAVYEADGSALVEVAWSTDGVAYSAWTDVFVARRTSVRARYLKARITVAATGPAPVPLIRSFLVLMRAQPVVHEVQDLNTAALNPLQVLAVGDVRLPVPDGRFSLIRVVSLTFNGMGPGYSWELVDRDPVLGPRVRLYNAQDVLTHATIDAVIRGL